MKRSKKAVWILLGLILLAAVAGAVCIGARVMPKVNYALRISELLQPVIEDPNQTMHIGVSAEVNGDSIGLESDVYMVTEGDVRYLALEQKGMSVYMTDNLLLLENGKAFKLGEKLQRQTASWEDLLPKIGALYEILNITAEKTEDSAVYEISVTAEQADSLLAAVSLGELPVEGIQKLALRLTEKGGKLEQIQFSGSGEVDGTEVALEVILSGFRILASGDYPIPEPVRQSAATVDPDALFSLTEDLYRLVLALAPFEKMEALDGTLELLADCGPLQFHTRMKLSELKTSSPGRIDPEKLQALPELLVWLCLEGDIRCTREGNAYVYALGLDAAAMKHLAGMILPELEQYGASLTEGNLRIYLEAGAITAMEVSLEGKITVLIAQIPVRVGANFSFD